MWHREVGEGPGFTPETHAMDRAHGGHQAASYTTPRGRERTEIVLLTGAAVGPVGPGCPLFERVPRFLFCEVQQQI
jgi:hypothetical protein